MRGTPLKNRYAIKRLDTKRVFKYLRCYIQMVLPFGFMLNYIFYDFDNVSKNQQVV